MPPFICLGRGKQRTWWLWREKGLNLNPGCRYKKFHPLPSFLSMPPLLLSFPFIWHSLLSLWFVHFWVVIIKLLWRDLHGVKTSWRSSLQWPTWTVVNRIVKGISQAVTNRDFMAPRREASSKGWNAEPAGWSLTLTYLTFPETPCSQAGSALIEEKHLPICKTKPWRRGLWQQLQLKWRTGVCVGCPYLQGRVLWVTCSPWGEK